MDQAENIYILLLIRVLERYIKGPKHVQRKEMEQVCLKLMQDITLEGMKTNNVSFEEANKKYLHVKSTIWYFGGETR